MWWRFVRGYVGFAHVDTHPVWRLWWDEAVRGATYGIWYRGYPGRAGRDRDGHDSAPVAAPLRCATPCWRAIRSPCDRSSAEMNLASRTSDARLPSSG